MTYEMETIEKIASKVSKYFKFPGYDPDDIFQEAVLIGLSVLSKFNTERGNLDSFLFISMSNGLRNLRKQKFFNYDRDTEGSVNESKKKIIAAKESLDQLFYLEDFDSIDTLEILEKINHYLPSCYRKDYRKIRDGIPVKTGKRNKVLSEVKRIFDKIMSDKEEELFNEDWATN